MHALNSACISASRPYWHSGHFPPTSHSGWEAQIDNNVMLLSLRQINRTIHQLLSFLTVCVHVFQLISVNLFSLFSRLMFSCFLANIWLNLPSIIRFHSMFLTDHLRFASSFTSIFKIKASHLISKDPKHYLLKLWNKSEMVSPSLDHYCLILFHDMVGKVSNNSEIPLCPDVFFTYIFGTYLKVKRHWNSIPSSVFYTSYHSKLLDSNVMLARKRLDANINCYVIVSECFVL